VRPEVAAEGLPQLPRRAGHGVRRRRVRDLHDPAAAHRVPRRVHDVTDRLRSRLAARADYIVLVGVPVDAPARWARASSYTTDELVTPEGGIPVDVVRAFVIAYPNLQILDAEPHRLALPDGFTWLRHETDEPPAELAVDDASAGLRVVDVRYSASPAHPHAADHYRTALVNLGDEPVRVLEFGAYVEVNGRYELSTIT